MLDDTHNGSAKKSDGVVMIASIELIRKVNDFVQRRITLRDLESWLVPRLSIYLDNPSTPTAELAGTIELCLAEIQDGIRTERGARQLLAQHVTDQPVVFVLDTGLLSSDEATSSSSVSETFNLGWRHSSPSWNTAVQVVSW